MHKLRDIINVLETVAPLHLQESYDNSGLLYGNPEKPVAKAIAALDLTDEVFEEALKNNADLIIVHHPPLFKPLKRIAYNDPVSQLLIKAIKHDVAIYACHTNLDNVIWGVNGEIARRLELKDVRVLSPMSNTHRKIICFVPNEYLGYVRTALANAGAGEIGNYDNCSFSSHGEGTFRGLDGADPFVGEIGQIHHEPETRLEMIFPIHLQSQIIETMTQSHPYETPAYDIISLENQFDTLGAGAIGILPKETTAGSFFEALKNTFHTGVIRFAGNPDKMISKVAICGGSGKSLINNALRSNADIFVTADLTYHDFFIPEQKMILADIGHFESEQFTSDLLVTILNEKIPNFAVLKSGINTNPVNYHI